MRKFSIFTVVLLVVVTTIQAQIAQIGVDINGEAVDDHSGRSVSLSDNGLVLAIGAPDNDGTALDAGSVRVYKNVSGTWTKVGADIDGEAAGDKSGVSVSLSADGSVLAIGATLNDGVSKTDVGSVRVYKNVSGTWSQIGVDIDGEAAGDKSGVSVSLSADGSVVAIGAIGNDVTSKSNLGHVRVYKNNGGTWTQVGADIDGEAESDLSGYSVSLSSDGSVVAIGAIGNDVNGLTNSGHVRVYKYQNSAWGQVGADIDGEADYDNSGASVSLSSDGSVVAIGATSNDGNGLTNSGSVRVYKNNGGTWTQIGADINGEAAEDYSGYSVSLSSNGSALAIGAIFNDGKGTSSGHVRMYQNLNGTWTQIGADINGEAAEDQFGTSVSLSADGRTLAIGASYNNNGTLSDTGHARVYGIGTLLTISKPISLNEIKIYPNPTSGKLTIDNGQLIIKNIEITDITGKTILSSSNSQIKQFSNLEIDLSGLNNGIYFISIQTDNEIFTSKIIKK